MKRRKKIHNGKYDYSLTNYVKSNIKITIICKKHNFSFLNTPNNHLRKAFIECKFCRAETPSTNTLSTEQVIFNFRKHHENLYNYSLMNYVNQHTKIEIICSKHGVFKQTPNSHYKSGCPKCSNRISKLETEWLNSLSIPNDIEHRQVKLKHIGNRKRVDGFDPITNTVYEFYGDYWHGNPKFYDQNKINLETKRTFGELYQKTINREKLILSFGYKLITIWQSDFIYPARKNL